MKSVNRTIDTNEFFRLEYKINYDGSVLGKTLQCNYLSIPVFARNDREDFIYSDRLVRL